MIQLNLTDEELKILISAVHTELKFAEQTAAKRAAADTMYYAVYEEYVESVSKLYGEIMRQAFHPAHRKE